RWAIIKPCTVVKLIGLGDEVSIACNERPTGVRLTRTRHSTGIRVRYSRIRDYRHNSPEAISGISVVPAERIGAQIGVERVIVFRNKGIAAPERITFAHTLFKRENPGVVRTGV